MSTDKRENMTFAERKKEFELQIQNAETIAISGHMNPDGDCIGFLSWTLYLYCGTVSRETGNTIIRTGTGKVFFFEICGSDYSKKRKYGTV